MLNLSQKLLSQNLGKLIRSVVFFIFFYFYLLLGLNVRLIYHGGGAIVDFPIFFRGWVFFQQFVSHPGGVVEYLAAFLSQFLYYSWSGALVLTIVAWLVCVFTDAFIKAIKYPALGWVRFIGPTLLLVIYTRYAYHFVTTVALLVALAFVCLYLKITPKRKLLGSVVFLVLSVILYYIAAGAYLLFAVLCGIYELLFRRRWQVGLFYLLAAVIISYVEGVLVFGVSIMDAFGRVSPLSWETNLYETRRKMITAVYILYLMLPLMAIVLGLWSIVNTRFSTLASSIRHRVSSIERRASGIQQRAWILKTLVLFVSLGTTIFFSYNPLIKASFEVDYYACHKMWPEVLEVAHRYPDRYSPYVVNAVNRALYHSGRLGRDMFCYPQNPHTLLLTAKEYSLSEWKKFDSYIELGFINMAESLLTESLAVHGWRPMILKRLALINMVKGNIGSARVFLGALSKTFFYADWANSYLDKIESDSDLSTDEQIKRLRSLNVEKDYGSTFFGGEELLSALLEKNKKNRMAFEYLMAHYLLTNQLNKLVEELVRLDDFDYTGIPRLYEEAMLLYAHSEHKVVDLGWRKVSPKSHHRFDGFLQLLSNYGGDRRAAFNDLAKHYGDSYFFYAVYGRSGLKR